MNEREEALRQTQDIFWSAVLTGINYRVHQRQDEPLKVVINHDGWTANCYLMYAPVTGPRRVLHVVTEKAIFAGPMSVALTVTAMYISFEHACRKEPLWKLDQQSGRVPDPAEPLADDYPGHGYAQEYSPDAKPGLAVPPTPPRYYVRDNGTIKVDADDPAGVLTFVCNHPDAGWTLGEDSEVERITLLPSRGYPNNQQAFAVFLELPPADGRTTLDYNEMMLRARLICGRLYRHLVDLCECENLLATDDLPQLLFDLLDVPIQDGE